VAVAAQPRVACFCTGSELVAAGGSPLAGQKLSLNSMLLQHLIPCYGGSLIHQGLIADNGGALDALFTSLAEGNYHLAISTGGMGPGKYDLVKQAFRRAGGEILLHSLPMLPGRSLILGILGETLFIALPGPPNAVRTLINEFVGPIILLLQGAQFPWPKKLQAQLMEACRMRQSDFVQVKGGVLQLDRGMVLVRPAERLDAVSCFIHFVPGRKEFAKGELVEVHVNGGDNAALYR
jgi:molybdopterin molybdotransferase